MRNSVVLLMMWLAAATTVNVSGEWMVSGSFDAASVAKGMKQKTDLVCYLTQKDEALTGECRPANGPVGIPVTGRVQRNRVEWHFDIALGPGSKKQTATYTSTVNAAVTRLKGTFSIADRLGAFTAKKE